MNYFPSKHSTFEQATNAQCQDLGAKNGRSDADTLGKEKGKKTLKNTMPTTKCKGPKTYGKRKHDDYAFKKKEKRDVVQEKPDWSGSAKMNINNLNEYFRMSEHKKRLSVWTPELHQKFLEAVKELGDNSTVSFLSLYIEFHSPFSFLDYIYISNGFKLHS